MKKIFKQYIQIIGYSLTGIAFGFAFFYFFLNMYHYQELRREAYIDFTTNAAVIQLRDTLQKVEENVNVFNSSAYQGRLDLETAGFWNVKLQVCVHSFQNETLQNILKKKSINIKDVYDLRESFENQVLNTCVVKQLYSLTSDQRFSENAFIQQNKELLKNYMDDLLQDTSYLKKDLASNSNYYFVTDMAALSGKNNVEDGFYEVMSSYIKSARFLESITNWYKSEVGGVE